MSMGTGLAAFAAGFGKGYMSGKELQRQHEIEKQRLDMEKQRADLEAKRLGLENDKLRREEEMQTKLHTAVQEVKPSQAFVVDTPEGRQIYTDKTTAEHAASSYDGASVTPAFVVAGKTFADKDAAQAAADAANSPAVQMRRKADIYSSYGREDLAAATMQNYKALLDNNRREMQQAYLDARDKGVNAVLDLYNKRLPNGETAKLAQGDNGPVLQLIREGKVVSQQPFDEQKFLADMDRRVAATPDNIAELWRADQSLGLQARQVATQENVAGAQVRHMDAQTADIPAQAADRRTQAQASATSAGAAATNARTAGMNAVTERARVLTPQISAVPTETGGLSFVTVPKTLDQQGNVSFGMPRSTVVPGVKHPGAYTADARNSLGLGLGTGLSPVGSPGFTITPEALQALQRANQIGQ